MNKGKKIFFSIVTSCVLTFSIGLNAQATNNITDNSPINTKFFTQSKIMQNLKLQGPDNVIKKLMIKSPEQKIVKILRIGLDILIRQYPVE